MESGRSGADLGFVLGGIAERADGLDLETPGSVGHQPAWVSYRSPKPVSRLDEIEETFNHLKVPASFADQFYVLPSTSRLSVGA